MPMQFATLVAYFVGLVPMVFNWSSEGIQYAFIYLHNVFRPSGMFDFLSIRMSTHLSVYVCVHMTV